jgi:hypothetical protein
MCFGRGRLGSRQFGDRCLARFRVGPGDDEAIGANACEVPEPVFQPLGADDVRAVCEREVDACAERCARSPSTCTPILHQRLAHAMRRAVSLVRMMPSSGQI